MPFYDIISADKLKMPDKLYKFRSWTNNNHKKIIIENKIYFASPKSFEDEKDCNPIEVVPDELFIRSFYEQKSIELHPDLNEEDRIKEVQEFFEQCPMLDPNKLPTILRETREAYYNQFGVLSLTENIDNDAMWNKYADDYRGVCIKFNTEKLMSIAGGGGKVIYCDNLPKVVLLKDDTLTEHIKRVYYKENKWMFEEEYRAHKMWAHGVTNEERNLLMPEGTIEEVIIGYRMPNEEKEDLIKYVNQYQPQAIISIFTRNACLVKRFRRIIISAP